jgi:UDP-N-acetylmuramoylalanine--D-glutamate ligase
VCSSDLKTCGDKVAWQKCDNMKNAFNIACEIASEGDVILLSPACASYDQWKNFEQRGDAFIEMFENLKNSN